jgi:hypothetical protein
MNVKRFVPPRGKRPPINGVAVGRIRLDRDRWGRLVLFRADGKLHTGIEPVRAFPFSDPKPWISLRNAEGQEIHWIEHLTELDVHSRAVLEDELAQREFVPVICKIQHISTQTEPSEWTVETDRGVTRFALNSEDDVRILRARRVLILDANGMRYLIPNVRALDAASRRLLDRYI